MTRPRYDNKSTEFGLWLREQKEIDSNIGFVTTNIDYFWQNYKTEDFMLIEEKRHFGELTMPQKKAFKKIHNILLGILGYRGFYIIQFQNTSPNDGGIYISGRNQNDAILKKKKIDRDGLIKFLRFEI